MARLRQAERAEFPKLDSAIPGEAFPNGNRICFARLSSMMLTGICVLRFNAWINGRDSGSVRMTIVRKSKKRNRRLDFRQREQNEESRSGLEPRVGWASAQIGGTSLHIRDPRGIATQYFRFEPTGRLKEITIDEFFVSNDGSVEGVALDDPRKIYLLENGNATMLKRSKKEMIYAVKFDPLGFDAKLLAHLHGLPNLEQIQLAGCNVQDQDLKQLSGFGKLMGIALDQTAITDAGLSNLKELPGLIVLEHEGTAITEEGLKAIGLPR
jgi:hypothetical protein